MSGKRPNITANQVMERLLDLTVKQVNNLTLSRSTLPGLVGKRATSYSLDQGCRNLDKECGYIEGDPSIIDYRLMYDQEGSATRIVGVYPEECWSIYPELYEEEDDTVTRFERVWADIQDQIDPWYYLNRVDELSGIGHFGILLIGIDDGRTLDMPVEGIDETGQKIPNSSQKVRKILYLRPFSEDLVKINGFETNVNNPRYGQPTNYLIKMIDPSNPAQLTGEPTELVDQGVHWTRIIHVADNCKSSEVFGTPRLKNLHRRVFDIRKILGSSGEMFYKGGFPGIVFETDPKLVDLADVDMDSLRTEIQAYSEGLQRYMRLVGMTAKNLLPQAIDPGPHLAQQYQYICATLGTPLNKFLGSEYGKVSGESTSQEWNRKLARRQNIYINKRIIWPFIRRLQAMNVLPDTKNGKFILEWKDLNALSDGDKADRGLKLSQAILQYVTSGAWKLIRPKMYFTLILQISPIEADAIINEAGGEDALVTLLQGLADAMAGNTPNSTGTNPTNNTGAGGRRNSQGRGAGNTTSSRNGGNATS